MVYPLSALYQTLLVIELAYSLHVLDCIQLFDIMGLIRTTRLYSNEILQNPHSPFPQSRSIPPLQPVRPA